MTRKEIKQKKARLVEILKEGDPDKRRKDLEELAKIVGASVTRIVRIKVGSEASKVYYKHDNVITETEIVHNIQVALQTETMIDMCRISGRNFWIAVIASIIAVISVLINFLSMVATWVAALVK